jgi:hypothetical protein
MADIINPSSTGMTHNADVYWHYSGDPVQRSQLLGTFTIGAPQKVLLPIPADADIVLRCVPRGGRGQGFMAGPGDATPHTISALGVGTGGGTSNFYQGLRVNHGYSYGTTPTPRPILNLLQSFQVKDDAVFGESDLTTFGVPTGQLNLKTDFNASGQIAVTTATSSTGSDIILATTLELQPGQGIYVAGAGVSGAPLITTCLAVSADGKTITLNAGPFTTGSYPVVQADDTAAVQAWLNAKGDLAMPPGYYRLTSSITMPTTSEGFSIIIHGSGWDQSQFVFQHGGDGFIPTSDLRIDSVVFCDLTVATGTIGNTSGTIDAASRGIGIRWTSPGYTGIYDNFVMQRCRVIGWGRFGLWSDNLEVSWISQCIFRENKSGHVAFVGPDTISPNKQPNANTITDTTFDQAISAGPSDAKRTFSGSMTSGSRTLSGSGFTINDRGKFVIVHGAATIGGDLYSFIDTFNSSTSVTLAHQAQATTTNTVELFPVNVASILLNRANDTVVDGSTIQGNFADAGSGATNVASDVNAIKAYNSANCRFIGIHEEDNAGPGGAAIRMENCIAMTIENWGGTSAGPPNFDNAHSADFQLINCHCIRVAQCYFNDRPQFVIDSSSSEIEIDNSLVTGYINLWQQDNSWDKLKIGSGVRLYQAADPRTNQTAGNEYLYDSLFGRDLMINGRFLDVVSGNFEGWTSINPTWWSNPYSSLTREGSYIRVDATAIAASTAPSIILHQAVAIPDTALPGLYTLGFDWYLESQNGVETTGYYTEVRLHPSSGIDEVCQFSTRRFSVVTGIWQRNQIRCFLGSGTSRTIDVQINVTPGTNNVKIRFTNFRLAAGKHVFGAYERAVHDFGGRMRAPLEMLPISSTTYPAPPTAGQVTSMISLVNIAGVLNVGKAGVYSPITTGSSSGHIIQDETVALAAEPVLNFTGSGIRAVDNPIAGNPRTDVFVVAATPTQEGTVSTAAQSFAGTKTFGDGLVAQLPSGAVSGTHIQEWRISSGGSVIAWLDTQPILRLGAPSVIDGFLELASGGGASTVKLAAAVTPTAAQTLRFPAAFPTAGNVLSVAAASAGIVTLAWSTASTGHTIMEEGGALIQRGNLNFVGQGITAADVAGNTQVTLNAATQTTEGIVSTVAQNFGGLKTFFAGAIMQGTGVSQPVLTVQGQGASGSVHIQEWKDSGGVFSVGYFTLDAQFRIGNPNAYTGWLELCSQSSGNTTKFVCATTPAASLVYVWPANTPAATQVLGVSSIAGSTVTMAWQTGGSGSGVGGNGTVNYLARWSSASIPGTLTDSDIENTGTRPSGSLIFHAGFLLGHSDGFTNMGTTSNRFATFYCRAVNMSSVLGTGGAVASAGWQDAAVGEVNRWWHNGVGTATQTGNGQRLQLYSYHGIEIRGNRRSGSAPAFTTISGTDSSGVIIFQEINDVPPIVINSAFTLTSSLLVVQNNFTTKLAITAAGSIWSEGGIRNAVALIQPAGGTNVDLTNYYGYHILILDTLNGSFTVTLPLLTALNAGIRWRLICNRRTSTQTVTVKCQAGNDINETGVGTTSGWILRPNTNNARDAIVTGDYYNTQQWWLANLIV